MAKSDCGLPANNHATRRCISKEEEQLRVAYAYGKMTFKEFERKYRQLVKVGLIWRK